MRGDRHEIGAERGDVERQPGGARDRVDMDEGLAGVAHPRDELAERLDRPDLVVRQLQADERDPLVERLGELVGVGPPVAVDRQDGRLEAPALQVRARLEHRLVLDRGWPYRV